MYEGSSRKQPKHDFTQRLLGCLLSGRRFGPGKEIPSLFLSLQSCECLREKHREVSCFFFT